MKKLLFIAVLTFGIAASSQAQENEFAIKGGLNYSNLTGDDVDNLDSRVGFHLGILYHLGISDDFAIQPELLLSTKGAEETNLMYLDLPVLAHVHITESFSAHFGPQIGFLLSAKDDGDDVKDFYKSTDISAVAGLTYRLETGLFFTTRYNYGISNIGEEFETQVPNIGANGFPDGTTSTVKNEFEASNSVLQLSIGYMF